MERIEAPADKAKAAGYGYSPLPINTAPVLDPTRRCRKTVTKLVDEEGLPAHRISDRE